MTSLLPAKNKGDCPVCFWRKRLVDGKLPYHPQRDVNLKVVARRCGGSGQEPMVVADA